MSLIACKNYKKTFPQGYNCTSKAYKMSFGNKIQFRVQKISTWQWIKNWSQWWGQFRIRRSGWLRTICVLYQVTTHLRTQASVHRINWRYKIKYKMKQRISRPLNCFTKILTWLTQTYKPCFKTFLQSNDWLLSNKICFTIQRIKKSLVQKIYKG